MESGQIRNLRRFEDQQGENVNGGDGRWVMGERSGGVELL